MLVGMYGSLREGRYNHDRFGMGKALAVGVVPGYDMYHNGAYPFIIAGEGSVVIEVHDIPEAKAATIHSMEVGAGYKAIEKEIEIEGKGYQFIIYEFVLQPTTKFKVDTGDWSEYVEENGLDL